MKQSQRGLRVEYFSHGYWYWKTYTAFQIIYRLWKSGAKKRILFLADRTALIDQTARGDFRHFKDAMTTIKHKKIDTAYNIYLALYQGLSDSQVIDAYKQFSPDFFDLVLLMSATEEAPRKIACGEKY